MSYLWTFIKNLFTTLGSVIQIVFQLFKFIFQKCFKFILAILSAIIGIFITKRAVEKE